MTYFVTQETVCPECGGRKFTESGKWQEYGKWETEFRRDNGRMPTMNEHERWWMEQGYYKEFIPPEEVPCGECDGEGTIVKKVNLLDALQDLKVQS